MTKIKEFAPSKSSQQAKQGVSKKLTVPSTVFNTALVRHSSNSPDFLENNETLNSYLQIVENIQSKAREQGAQIIGFSGVASQQGTSLLLSIISYLISAEIDEDVSYLVTSQNSEANAANTGVDYETLIKKGLCLIDANLHNPTMHKIFGLSNESGLCDILSDKDSPSLQGTFIFNSNFEIVTAGPASKIKKPVLNWGAIEPLLTRLRSKKKYIFLDIPPILKHADAMRLCKYCDAVALVVQANQARREVVVESRRALEKSGVNVLGGILTNRKFFIPGWLYRKL